ncbi:helix-turn-helix domain-containing protein [Streptomyces sp. HD]|uniref:helix-turn-helix domain-containing protein n=1 Tax=Streptomyces sp. HD TaxID=3020892 RepID=UPI002331479D|nr:helix-turn-helix transcriptional regulator [Streptomyces sp. HD]MDC0766156.1 helix-turn-helix transcriptional regulator [Streptomyces sp. HD]
MANGSRLAAWEFFGSELKRQRENAETTQAELGSRVFVSGGYIGQFEQAIRKPQLDVAQRIDEALQTDGFFERMWRQLIQEQKHADYFAHAAELEEQATKICDWEPSVIPGLLQTPAYTSALVVATHPFATDELIDERVTSRVERSQILKDATRPEYWAIVHETVLRVPVGGPVVAAEALEHMAALARERKVVLQVFPFSAGPPANNGSLRLMEFDEAPPTAYTETSFSGSLLDDPAVVKRANRAYDLLRGAALSPEASLALIESAAEDFRRCTGTS